MKYVFWAILTFKSTTLLSKDSTTSKNPKGFSKVGKVISQDSIAKGDTTLSEVSFRWLNFDWNDSSQWFQTKKLEGELFEIEYFSFMDSLHNSKSSVELLEVRVTINPFIGQLGQLQLIQQMARHRYSESSVKELFYSKDDDF